MELNDAALLDRWRRGDQVAGEQLFEAYYDTIERFFLNKVTSGVADLVQETFVACVEARDRVRDSSKFRSYLFSIAYNVLRAHLRRNYRGAREFNLDDMSVCDVNPGPGTVMTHQREQRLLLEALRSIPVEYQIILELHYWEQMITADIADTLALPLGTVRSRLRRARELLEQALSKLSNTPKELQSTVTKLDDWADKCRRDILASQAQ
ncbi:MAG: sigma-70 family RNA polymerase sigma factor [Haliangiales bacterium]